MGTSAVLDQIGSLMKKDRIIKQRHCCGSVCMIIGPSIFVFIGGLAAFILTVNNIEYEVRPLQTQEKSITRYSSSYTFNPFPLDCWAIAPPQENAAWSWRYEGQMKLMNYTNYDCFIDGMAASVPLWRSLTLQLRSFPVWKPMPLTFAVAPGKQGDTSTVGGQFEWYMNKRYQENQILNIRLHTVFDNCFSNGTWTGRVYSQCVDQYPVECLLQCLTIPAWQTQLVQL